MVPLPLKRAADAASILIRCARSSPNINHIKRVKLERMSKIDTILASLRQNRDFMSQVVAWERIPARRAQEMPFPAGLTPQLKNALQQRGFVSLYRHQAQAVEYALEGQNVVVATATASGKTLCYTLPVFNTLLSTPNATTLYLFPTKALAHDQLAEAHALCEEGDLPLSIMPYDGDTPQSMRRKVQQESQIMISNPDMLHSGILPFHTRWRRFLSQLRYVVIDEIHAYRGVFGSHVANVIRRLRRLCHFYGANPQFICCSATIANPREHAERMVELPFSLVGETENGAPAGARSFLLYNPPIIDETLGMRQSSILAAKDAALTFLQEEVQTVVFARARQTVELLLTYLRDELAFRNQKPESVTGYRGGYLPLERRSIERGLRNGDLRGVVATNALELGIDIGGLDAAVLTGYPGSIASTWQQAGRAGRKQSHAIALMIASGNALDQYICNNPRYLFGQSPEHALINPDNLRLMVKHLLCAAYELPFQKGEPFGAYTDADELLMLLTEEGALHETSSGPTTQYHWLGEGLPAHTFSLRTSGDDRVVIQEIGEGRPRVIGELDLESVPMMAYEGAIYMHQAETYQVDHLDWEGRLAEVRPVAVDYYTRASIGTTIQELSPEQETTEREILRAYGDVLLVTKATGFRKIKRYTHETLGFGDIDLPEMTLFTSGYWLIFSEALTEQLEKAGVLLRPNDYGPNWQTQRLKVLDREGHRCKLCGAEAKEGQGLHVHHLRPFREFGYIPGQNENFRQANQIENLVALCPSCHRQAEQGQQARSALGGLAYALRNLAPLWLMCDPGDIQVTADSRNPLTKAPTLVVYERIPAGIGFSQKLFEIHDQLLQAALEMVSACRCRDGCPACVGPPGDIGPNTKAMTITLLQILNAR